MQYFPEEIRAMQGSLWKKLQLDEKEKNNIMKNVLTVPMLNFYNPLGLEIMISVL